MFPLPGAPAIAGGERGLGARGASSPALTGPTNPR